MSLSKSATQRETRLATVCKITGGRKVPFPYPPRFDTPPLIVKNTVKASLRNRKVYISITIKVRHYDIDESRTVESGVDQLFRLKRAVSVIQQNGDTRFSQYRKVYILISVEKSGDDLDRRERKWVVDSRFECAVWIAEQY